MVRQADPVDRRVKRVYVTKQARGFLEKLRKEIDKFNIRIVTGIDRKQLENDIRCASGHEAQPARHGGRNTLPESRKEDDEKEVQRTGTRKRRRTA